MLKNDSTQLLGKINFLLKNTQRGLIHIKMFFHDVERFVLDSIVILGWRRNAENLHLNKVRLFLLAKRQYIVTVTPCCSYRGETSV